MGGDHKFYYNFSTELPLSDWNVVKSAADSITLAAVTDLPAGAYVLLYPADDQRFPALLSVTVNGEPLAVRKREAVYIHSLYPRYGIEITLSEGKNTISAVLSAEPAAEPDKLPFFLQKDEADPAPYHAEPKLHHIPAQDYAAAGGALSLDGFTEGVGRSPTVGRFGYLKGDGLLDCAMPALGMVDKMFLCGQPKYQKPYRWSYTLLPEDMPLHGSLAPFDTGIGDDDISINHLSASWAAVHQGRRFACTYSLASPAILTEREDGCMRLGGLRYAGSYRSVLIPRADGVEECDLDTADIAGMAENWILLFNSSEFPDVPLMLVFDRNPASMTVTRDGHGRLRSIDFTGTPLMFSLTPFGIERFAPSAMPVPDAVRRARFWSRAVLAYPVRHKEYFRLDEAHKEVTIRQSFEYRTIRDAWGTQPLETAPFPPPTSICGTAQMGSCTDFEFPTKYGHLRGKLGSWSEYTIPMMPTERRFPLRSEGSKIPDLLADGMEKYRALVSAFSDEVKSYPYAGALLEPFALTSTMSLFMSDDDRAFLRDTLSQRLEACLNPDHDSDYVVINWGEMMRTNPEHDEVRRIYEDPARPRLRLRNWFTRIEPFTGQSFNICYLNVGMFSSGTIKTASPEEIRSLKLPLIENDWGVGLTFYYLYLASLAAGTFEPVRRHWQLLRSVYYYFELMHDFACMGTGYSDNAITWVEGANYGAFTSYIKMAEAVGDRDARDFGIYNAAKQFALRLAVIHASVDYFPRYFDVNPWYVAKFFHEELSPAHAFQNYPNLSHRDVRSDAVYNFTTEGLYPEAYAGLRQYGGALYDDLTLRLEEALLDGLTNSGFRWGLVQQFTALLIDRAHNPASSVQRFHELIEEGISRELLIREWRGIHIFSRALPKNYFLAQLLAWMEMREHKAWLTFWEETCIERAVFADNRACISFTYSGVGEMRIVLGVTEPPQKILLNGCEISGITPEPGLLELRPDCAGLLELIF